MKTPEMKTPSPWPVIRWMAAGVIYLLTLAIAVNEVKTRQSRIDELEAGLKSVNAGLSKLARSSAQQVKEAEGAIKWLEQQEQVENDKTLLKLRELERTLKK